MGASVSTAGDVNGAGYSDVIAGADSYDNGESAEGQAFVYYGNSGLSLTGFTPRQLQAGGSRIEALGRSGEYDRFKISLLARPESGRTRARVLYEVKPLGTPMNGTGLVAGNWFTSGISGTSVENTISGLSAQTAYAWRARVLYFPYLNYSRWFSANGNGKNEQDLKTSVQPTPTPTNTPTVTPTPTSTPTVAPTASPVLSTPTPLARVSSDAPRPVVRVKNGTVILTIVDRGRIFNRDYFGYLVRADNNRLFGKKKYKVTGGVGRVYFTKVPADRYWAFTLVKRGRQQSPISSRMRMVTVP